MAALVQVYPRQSRTPAMVEPTSTSIMSGQNQPNYPYMGPPAHAPRYAYHPAASSGYRGGPGNSHPHGANYGFNHNQGPHWQNYGGYRTASSSSLPMHGQYDGNSMNNPRHAGGLAPHHFVQNQYGSNQMNQINQRDENILYNGPNNGGVPRPQSAYFNGHNQHQQTFSGPGRSAPDRYRRAGPHNGPHGRSQSTPQVQPMSPAAASRAAPSSASPLSPLPTRSSSVQPLVAGASKDDLDLPQRASVDGKQRGRRRSVHNLDTVPSFDHDSLKFEEPIQLNVGIPGLVLDKDLPAPGIHSRSGSSHSVASNHSTNSRPSSAHKQTSFSAGHQPGSNIDSTPARQGLLNPASIPPRGSSSEAAKRSISSSPLSKPVSAIQDAEDEKTVSTSSPTSPPQPQSNANFDSPAAKQLAALNQAGSKAKSKTSRLRRAFSFGSPTELRKAGSDEVDEQKPEPAKLHKDPTPQEAQDAEQARIAQAQEAAGLGNSIYGGRFFGGSTDNLSISSTASSASVMIRKMGRGMKKSTRSLVGLFRPKSVLGNPDATSLDAGQAEVSLITVEAETQRVNVNPNPGVADGGTGFPRLERNSVDASQGPRPSTSDAGPAVTPEQISRKSILGGERERSEVLAAVRKGILKRTSEPVIRTVKIADEANLPSVPTIADSPNSSAPSTPNDEVQGHRRTGSVTLDNEDYFMTALRLRQEVQSAPVTPQAGSKRTATFSPRIVFHDTWPSQEYDRRGEIATCNRLTPMLAQQIKEELNSFKMEMEVHENSKIYTHFF